MKGCAGETQVSWYFITYLSHSAFPNMEEHTKETTDRMTLHLFPLMGILSEYGKQAKSIEVWVIFDMRLPTSHVYVYHVLLARYFDKSEKEELQQDSKCHKDKNLKKQWTKAGFVLASMSSSFWQRTWTLYMHQEQAVNTDI